jgi:hypothetical protein
MHRMLKITSALAATAALAAAPATWSHSAAASSATLTLVGQPTGDAFLDHDASGEEPTVGDEFVTAERLLRDGEVVGQAGGSCQIVAPAANHQFTFHCTVTLRLPAGQIAMDGLATFGEQGPQPMAMAITGGTGSYRLARGQATVEEEPTGEVRYRLSIHN